MQNAHEYYYHCVNNGDRNRLKINNRHYQRQTVAQLDYAIITKLNHPINKCVITIGCLHKPHSTHYTVYTIHAHTNCIQV